MEKRNEFLCVALDLNNHPLRNEKTKFRVNYINALEYFNDKYSKKGMNAEHILDKYRKNLIVRSKKYIEDYNYKKGIKKVCSFRFKGFKLFTYRFLFVYDCLFINAFHDPELGKEIVDEFKTMFSSRYHAALEELYKVLYNGKSADREFKLAENQMKVWFENKRFFDHPVNNIIVTATMSAGKSTLINAISGKKLARTKNEACTDTANFYFNKAFEDNLIVKRNSNLEFKYETEYRDEDEYADICTYMNLTVKSQGRLCLIDTPGINSSLNKDHAEATQNAFNSINYEKIIYVINATNIGAEDDIKYMKKIRQLMGNKSIIFVLNKIDTFRPGEDDIEDSINALKSDLTKIGFQDPVICPTSAYAAGVFKKLLKSEKLSEEEELDCSMLLRKFSRDKYDLSKFYTVNSDIDYFTNDNVSFEDYDFNQIKDCLYKTGIANLEKLIIKGEV